MNSQSPEGSSSPSLPPPARINWPLFFLALFLPTVVVVLAVQAKAHDAPPIVALVGSGLSGLICGVLLGRRLGRTTPARVLLSLLFVLVMGAVALTMNCLGCLASGSNLNFH